MEILLNLVGKLAIIAADAYSNREADRNAAHASLQRIDAALDAEVADGAARRAAYKAEEQRLVDEYEKGLKKP